MAVCRAESLLPAPVSLVLTEADRDLIARAASAFRGDFRYLEQVLWQARSRRSAPARRVDLAG